MIFKPLEAAVSRNPSIVVPADTAATAAPAQGTDIPPEEGAGADGALIGPLGMITFVPMFIQESARMEGHRLFHGSFCLSRDAAA